MGFQWRGMAEDDDDVFNSTEYCWCAPSRYGYVSQWELIT